MLSERMEKEQRSGAVLELSSRDEGLTTKQIKEPGPFALLRRWDRAFCFRAGYGGTRNAGTNTGISILKLPLVGFIDLNFID